MKRNNFLNKLLMKGNLDLVEPNKEVCDSYLEKSKNCLTSAKLLSDNSLFENSVSMSYYTMYNSLVALLFLTGVKCENHSGSILLLKLLFSEQRLFKLISDAKEERIDRQYYVTTDDNELTKDATKKLLIDAETFFIGIKLIIHNMNSEAVENVKKNFRVLVGLI